MTDRRVAYNVLDNVLNRGMYLHLALKKATYGIGNESASYISALAYATVENLNYSDFIINKFVDGRLHKSIRLILRMGIAELIAMHTASYAVINESVKLTHSIGKGKLSGFVNAVLRRVDRERDNLPQIPDDDVELLNIRYGLPKFLAKEYLSLYGRDFTVKMRSTVYSGVTLRAQYPFSNDELVLHLKELGIDFSIGRMDSNAIILNKGYDVASDSLFSEGKIAIQSESAMLVCKACKVKKGMKVLDACSAPGGKTAYIASLTENDVDIQAWELHEKRVEITNLNFLRLGVNAVCTQHDAAILMPQKRGCFDVVLVDAPCSGFGVTSKPDTFLNRTENSIQDLCKVQRQILDCCAEYVAPGGALVYATCTISKSENEDCITQFVEINNEFEPDDFSDVVPSEYSERIKSGMLQLFPHLDSADGFFIARMVKRK